MSPIKTLQLIKEQLKAKTLAFKKLETEKDKTGERLTNTLELNQKRISELLSHITDIENKLQTAEEKTWAAQMARHARLTETNPDLNLSNLLSSTQKAAAPPTDSELKKEFNTIKGFLKEQIQIERDENKKISQDKKLLTKELLRLRKEVEKIAELEKKIESLTADLNLKPLRHLKELERLVKEKDRLLTDYENILFGNVGKGDEGVPPSEIISNLNQKITGLTEKNNDLEIELEKFQEHAAELETKLSITKEKSTSDRIDYRFVTQDRTTASKEFSTGLESFLITYSDMITLLLVIFVLLYTVSKVDEHKYAEAISSFQEKQARINTLNVRLSSKEFKMLTRVRELVRDNVDPESLIRGDTTTIIIRLKSADLFDPGGAELTEGAGEIIFTAINDKIQDGVKQIKVEGHTDDVPMKTEKFPSNWELSTARASRVGRYLITAMNFPPGRIVVTGFGEFRPILPNDSDDNRATNRRVEIKILKDREVHLEEQKRKASLLSNKILKTKENNQSISNPAP